MINGNKPQASPSLDLQPGDIDTVAELNALIGDGNFIEGPASPTIGEVPIFETTDGDSLIGSGVIINNGEIVTSGFVDALSYKVGGVDAVADGTYTVGKGTATDGTITITGGIITAIQEATDV